MRAPKRIIGRARELRRTLSVPEAQLWRRLRARIPGQPVFRRQHCAKASLAVEVDGISHDMGHRPTYDERRDSWLSKHGILVIRIPAAELRRSVDEAADAVIRLAAEKS